MSREPDLDPADPIRVVARLRAAGCVFAEDEARLLIEAADGPRELAVLVRRRVEGLPLEHLLGWVEFRGLRLEVDPGVFVPRTRTGFLVERAAAVLPAGPAVVVDLCCGCGAVGVALAAASPGVELHCADVDPAAVRCAARNAAAVGGTAHLGDLYDALPPALRGRVDVLAVNAPYVPTDEIRSMPPEARLHEPRVALDGGPDGLDVQRRVAAGAPEWLAPAGHLLIETGRHQAAGTLAAVTAAGLTAHLRTDDTIAGTVVLANLSA